MITLHRKRSSNEITGETEETDGRELREKTEAESTHTFSQSTPSLTPNVVASGEQGQAHGAHGCCEEVKGSPVKGSPAHAGNQETYSSPGAIYPENMRMMCEGWTPGPETDMLPLIWLRFAEVPQNDFTGGKRRRLGRDVRE